MVFGKAFRALSRISKLIPCSCSVEDDIQIAVPQGSVGSYSNTIYYFSDPEITLERKLGEGEFSQVYLGKNSTNQRFAVKRLKHRNYDEFFREINILITFGSSPYAVEFRGFYVDDGLPAIIMEFCEEGDLHGILRRMKEDGVSWDSTWARVTAYKISRAMEFLSEKRIIHRDLSARNCLVTKYGLIKIGDFGQARKIGRHDSIMHDYGIIAIAWMPPEAVNAGEFNLQSDVWSYGVTISEICTLGDSPFGNLPIQEVANAVSQGTHPPASSTDALLNKIMKLCWNVVPAGRPTFMDISEVLKKELSAYDTK